MKQFRFKHQLIVYITVFLISCGNKGDKPKDIITPVDNDKPAVNDTTVTKTGDIKLSCKDLGLDSLGTPHFDVLLSLDGKETKIKSINGCTDIAKSEYKRYEIPNDAIAACGGWWAGAGDYYYVILEEGKPVVFEGWQDESQKEKGYHWKKIIIK